MNNFDPKDDDYVVELFKKRYKQFVNKEVDKEEEEKYGKIFQSEDEGIKYERKDIFFSNLEEEDPYDYDSSDTEDEEEEEEEPKTPLNDLKKDDEKDDEESKWKKKNLLKFCQLSNPGLKGGKFARTSFQDQFKNLFNNEYLSDIVLTAKTFDEKETKKLFCHKIILSMRSNFFKQLFETPLKERNEKEVFIPGVSYEILCTLVYYLYTGVLNVTYQNSLLILAASDMFLMKDVKEIISKYFEEVMDDTIACMLYEESFFHNSVALRKMCLNYIESNSNEVIFSEAFKLMTQEMVMEIIKSDYLSVDEYKLFEGIVKWALAQENSEETIPEEKKGEIIRKNMKTLLEFIRFPLMRPIDLRDKIEKKYPGLISKQYLFEAYRFHVHGPKRIKSLRTRPRLSTCHFNFSSGRKSSYMRANGNGLNVTTTYNGTRASSCVSDVEWTSGLYYWEVKIENCGNQVGIMVGVTDKSTVNTETFLAYNRRGWAVYACNGFKYYNSRNFPYIAQGKLKKGDVIGVMLNLKDKTLGFFLNGVYCGEAFKDVEGPVSPAISLYERQDSITLNTHVRPPKIISV